MDYYDQIKRDEGLRLHPYTCTANKLSIGYGRNLIDNGITEQEAEILLHGDIKIARQDAQVFAGIDVWSRLSPTRQAVIINMAFNLGLSRLRKFKRLHLNLANGRFDQAAVEMLDSRWASQVGHRAIRLADAMRLG
jgi:lysozyme